MVDGALCLDPTKLKGDSKRHNDIVTFMQANVMGSRLREKVIKTTLLPTVVFVSGLDGLDAGAPELIRQITNDMSISTKPMQMRVGAVDPIVTSMDADTIVKLWSACTRGWSVGESYSATDDIVPFDNWVGDSANVENFHLSTLSDLAKLSPLWSLYAPGRDPRSLLVDKEAGTVAGYLRYSAGLWAGWRHTGGHIDTSGFSTPDLGPVLTRTKSSTYSTSSAKGIHVAGPKGWWTSPGDTLPSYVDWARNCVSIDDGLSANDILLIKMWHNNVITPRVGGINSLGTFLVSVLL
jgi:hypothetical protein